MEIKVTKLTGIDLLHKANAYTTGKESKQSLASAYRAKHTTIRTQLFLVECIGIPQYVAYHFRTHFTLYVIAPMEYGWMKSKRIDRGGADFRTVCQEQSNLLMEAYNAILSGDKETAQHNVLCVSDNLDDFPNEFDRYAPTDFVFMVSAEGLMVMAEKRLCYTASKETRETMDAICEQVYDVDPDLYPHLVPPCVAHGGICREHCCGFNKSQKGIKAIEDYKKLFE